MDFQDRFFGKGTPQPGGPPVANPLQMDPPSFQLLYSMPLQIDADALTLALRDYHTELADAVAEIVALPAPPEAPNGPGGPSGLMGLIGWQRHVIKVVGFNAPMPATVVDRCVQGAHYDPELKELAHRHAAHILLYYAGYESDILEQHVALAAAAAALTRFDALIAMNETARSSIPAPALLPHEEDGGDTLQAMRTLPLPFFYAGFLKLEVEGEPGIWMRTYGCHIFKLPDLAIRSEGHHQGTAAFNLFSNMLVYLKNEGRSFAVGDTVGIGEGIFLRMRDRTPEEWFLESEGPLFVLEPASADEVQAQ
jgi:hypothetical protein